MRELVTGPAGAGKTTLCVERSLAALSAGRRVVYLVPNHEETIQTRQRLLAAADRSALVLPGILRFGDLVRAALDAHEPGWSARPALTRRLKLTRLLADERERLGPLARSARSAGFPTVLDRFFRELDEGALQVSDLTDLAAEAPESADRARLTALARLYETFNAAQDAGRSWDPSRAMARAARLLERDADRALALPADDALLILDGFSNLSPLQLRFLNALLPRAAACLFTVCLPPADLEGEPRPPFERLRRLAESFPASEGWRRIDLPEPRRYEAALPRALATRLFREPADEPAGETEFLHLIRGATRRDEVDGVVRDLRDRLATGIEPAAAAILFRDETYGELFTERLRRERIPFRRAERADLTRRAVVKALLNLLDWAAGRPPSDLAQSLRGGLVGTSDARLAGIDAAARAAGVPGALTWDDLLREMRENAASDDEDWDWLDWKLALPEGPLTGADLLERVTRPLIELVRVRLTALLRDAVHAPRESEGPVSAPPPLMREAAGESLALQAFLTVTEAVAAEAAPPDRSLPLEAWLTHIRRALDGETIPGASTGDLGGVLVGNPFDLRLPELQIVYVCGLNQGSFPPPFRDHPLLRESERRRLNRRLAEGDRRARLPEWRDRQAEERYLFYIAVTRARARLVLSWAQRGDQGRAAAPSYFLDELRRTAGALPAPEDVPALSLPEKLRRPLGLRPLLRDTLLAGDREAGALTGPARRWLERLEGVPALFASRREREEPQLAGHPALARHLGERRRFSASRLEAYAQCPYRYLMERILNLEEEEDFEPGALEEGRLYHKALELLYADWDALRADLFEREPDGETIAELVASRHDAARDLLLAEGLTSIRSARFRAERPRRLRVLRAFVERDLRRLRETGAEPRPDALEETFGLPSAALPGAAGEGAAFDLTGIIDRVDRLPDGGQLVIDYKRSDRKIEPPDADPPTLFQLALYGLARGEAAAGAAYCALKTAKPLRGYYREHLRETFGGWSVSSATGAHWLGADAWRDWLTRVARRIGEIAGEIDAGRFAPAPLRGEETCRHCDFARICREAAGTRAGGGTAGMEEGAS